MTALDRGGEKNRLTQTQKGVYLALSGKTFQSGGLLFKSKRGLTTSYVCIETAVSDTCCHRTSSQTTPAGVGSGIFDLIHLGESMTLSQSIVETIKCPYCGVETYASVSHFDKKDTPYRTHFLCECKNNHVFAYNITFGNGLFITGATLIPNTEQKKIIYREYIQSEDWKVKSRNEKIKAGYRCMLCGKSGDDHSLNTHHNTYAHLGNEQPGELIVLCDTCHEKFHGKDE